MIDTQLLVERLGTPLYLYRLDRVAAAVADLRRALPESSTLYYSLKANPHPDIVRSAVSLGCHSEVSSVGELSAALSAGCPPAHCLYTGPGKTDGEIGVALRHGVRLFSVESPHELARLDGAAESHGVDVEYLIRVNVEGVVTATGLRMAGGPRQFGSDFSRIAAEPSAFLDTRRARVAGTHFFTATNVPDPKGLLEIFEANLCAATELRDKYGLPLRRLDLGGGFAAPYARPGERPRYDIRYQLESLLDRHFPNREDGPRIAFEAGRYLVAECGWLYCRVIDVKRSGDRTFAILDAGIHHLGGLSGLGRLLPVAASPILPVADRPEVTVDLAGPLCTPVDILGRDVRMPQPRPGDIIAIPNVGAYGLTASVLAFLGHPAPAEVAVNGEEHVSISRLAVSRQPIEEAQQ